MSVLFEDIGITVVHGFFYGLRCRFARVGSHIAVLVEIFFGHNVGYVQKHITSGKFFVIAVVENVHNGFIVLHCTQKVCGVELRALFKRADDYALFTLFKRSVGIVCFKIFFQFIKISCAQTRIENAYVEIRFSGIFIVTGILVSTAAARAQGQSRDRGEHSSKDCFEFFHHFCYAPFI